jgi:CRISPR-associated protein Csb2
MLLVVHQSFPLGRFHATPWRVNPFDDPFGEWPPSPWRLVRAVVARWHQWSRESGNADEVEADALVRALCDSTYSFHLPVQARRGSPLRQYQPVEFGWEPASRTKGTGENRRLLARMWTYGTRLTQDNYWCVPQGEAGTIWWFIEGDLWTSALVAVLDRCIERLVYFGRAESLTLVRRASGGGPAPNCRLSERPAAATSVRVLVPDPTGTRMDVERVTDDPDLARTIPPGARIMYADLSTRPTAREAPITFHPRTDCRFIQMAVGWHVPPEPRSVVRLTGRFRSAVLRELLLIKTGKPTWSQASASVRSSVAPMFGKDSEGQPLDGHAHAEFFAWLEGRVPTRLLVWRTSKPFDADEQAAVLRAASHDLSWAAAGPDADDWKVRLIPLDQAVPPPPGFDGTPSLRWESATPYVPPRHHRRDGGKDRSSESLQLQVARELALRGVPGSDLVDVQVIEDAAWVAVHVPRRRIKGQTLGDRLGYWLRLSFSQPVAGPLRLGHSSSFGLGLFKPVG